jgi:hypothetical protein
MPPSLAALLTLSFIGFMLWWDSRKQPAFATALWVPILWIFFVGSRFFGQWLTLLGIYGQAQASPEDGSTIDAAFFLLLILAGIVVLVSRKVSFSQFLRNNLWITIFFVYAFLAIAWSDFPLIAFKRWIKVIGHPVMALVILTEPDPVGALKRVLKRCAYIHLPLSILFIKYFPDWGRGFDVWTGMAANRGINLNKNELGYACMVFGLALFWNVLSSRRLSDRAAAKEEMLISGVFLAMIAWLLTMANSATAMMCLFLGCGTMLVLGSRLISKKHFGTYLIATVTTLVVLEATVGLYARILGMLGRNASLTDRTQIWADLFAIDINPFVGAGFESFWLGPRLEQLWAKWWWQPNQAHSGYIETYVNLGYVGLFILACLLLSTFQKSRRELLRNFEFGRFRMGVLFAVLAYNYTEAAFKGVHLVWTLFHLIAIDYATVAVAQAVEQAKTAARRPVTVLRRNPAFSFGSRREPVGRVNGFPPTLR